MLFEWNQLGSVDSGIKKVEETTLESSGLKEKDLENIIAHNIEELVRTDQLMVIMQERKWQEEPDIIAVDQKGILYIFELKRSKARGENLLQVLRYGQKFGRYDYDKLNQFFLSYSRNRQQSIELSESHKEFFQLDKPLSKDEFNKEQCFIVVTNGLDYDTWDAIAYWKEKGVNIIAQVYRVFKIEGKLFIDFDPYGPIPDAPKQIENGLFVINTNKTYMPDVYKEMVKERKGAAYYGRKYSIKKIRAEDPVCLYHTGTGIIGIGKARTDFLKKDVNGDEDEEYYIPIDFEYLIDINESGWENKAIHAQEMNERFQSGHKFMQAVFQLPFEFADFIKEKFKEKGVDKQLCMKS